MNTRLQIPGWLLLAVTTCSGAAALIYETLWARSLSIILGSTVQASSAVFAAFLTGLALGAYGFGERSTPVIRPVRAYLLLEVAIAGTACVTGLLLHSRADWLAAALALGPAATRAAAAFFVTLALVLVPTVLMGATFPLVLTVARRVASGASSIGIIYGFNTLGAALGTLGAGFFFIARAGITGTLGLAALLNLLCAALLVRYLGSDEASPTTDDRSASTPPAAEARTVLPEWLLLAIATASGALILAQELTWMRFAGFFVGNRIYAFSIVLACVLLMLAAGSWGSAWLVRRFAGREAVVLGWLFIGAAAATLLGAVEMVWWIPQQARIEGGLPHSGALLLIYRVLEVCLTTGPGLLMLGALFPTSLTISRYAASKTGRAVGRFYLVNTIGSVIGSLGVGFYGLSKWGAYGCAAIGMAICASLGLLLFWWQGRPVARLTLVGLSSAAVLLAIVPGLFSARLGVVSPGDVRLFRTEDDYGVLQVARRPDGSLKVTNNRTQLVFFLGLFNTSYVQQMQGHLGMFFRPQAKRAAVLGSGYGVTAGALGLYPQLEQIDAVEILPGMIAASDLFVPFNFSYHHNPRIHVVADDGRHFLARSTTPYDIISVNVSDPRMPGSGALFHEDFYRMAKLHLSFGGVVIQHAFGSQIRIALTTLRGSFKYLRLMPSYANGFNVVASDAPLEIEAAQIDRLLLDDEVRRAIEELGILPPLEARTLFQHLARPEDHPELFGDRDLVATDDHPLFEFAGGADAADLLFTND